MRMSKFGSKIKQLRIQKGITQEQLAQAVGLKHRTMIARYEQGVCVHVPYDNIVKLANYFDVSVDELIGNEEHDEMNAAYLTKLVDAGFTIENVARLTPRDMTKLGAYLQAILDAKE